MARSSDILRRNLANYETDWSRETYSRDGLTALELHLVESHFPRPPSRVLDIGCGAGRTTIALHERGHRVLGIDLSEGLLERARDRHPELDLRRMDATSLQLPDASFDAAFFSFNGIDCIFPVEARMKCLREVHRVLIPGGVFLLSSHNLIGTLFSGGYFYPTGHLNALRLLWRQRRNSMLRDWYVEYEDGGGTQSLYSAPPSRTLRQLVEAGFVAASAVGAGGENRIGVLTRRHMHVHFIARKRELTAA